MKKLIRRLFWSRWKIIKTIWPYPESYGTYCKNRWTGKVIVLDAGITKEQAIQTVSELNSTA